MTPLSQTMSPEHPAHSHITTSTRAGFSDLFHLRVFLAFPATSSFKERQARHSHVPCFLLPHWTPSGTWVFLLDYFLRINHGNGTKRMELVCTWRGFQREYWDRGRWQGTSNTCPKDTDCFQEFCLGKSSLVFRLRTPLPEPCLIPQGCVVYSPHPMLSLVSSPSLLGTTGIPRKQAPLLH